MSVELSQVMVLPVQAASEHGGERALPHKRVVHGASHTLSQVMSVELSQVMVLPVQARQHLLQLTSLPQAL